jgi:putative DNA primase/helicase
MAGANAQKTIMKTQTVIFDNITPHPAPVNVADLLNDIEATIKKHVILGDHAAAALTVWVLHTWTFELRDIVAYVAIESPEKRCGKTTLLSVLAAMAHKPLIASNVTVGALFRAIDTCRPTLFIDEADTFLAGNGIMRGIINSGNTWRTAYVLRLTKSKPNPVGEHGTRPYPRAVPDSEPSTINSQPSSDTGLKKYSCWCPKVIAMIGQAPDTIADRSIVVPMSRKLVTETCAPLAELNTTEIKSKCARFTLDTAQFITEAGKIRGEGLNDRAADTFDPLYVIARLAGGGWEQKLHAAARALSSTALSNNSGSELLLDIFSIFIQSGRERILIRDLAFTLREGGHGLKSFALKYSSINEHRISEILRSYGIKTTPVRDGKEVGRGYGLAQFEQAIGRYVPVNDFRARADELHRQDQLQAEARAEAVKESALIERVMAAAPKDRVMSLPETMALIIKLRENDNDNVTKCNAV